MDKRSGVIIIALLLVTAIVFTACGKSRESEETVSRSEAVEATSEPTTEESTETTAETTTTKEEPTTKAESETMVLIAVDKEKLPEEVSEDMLIYDEGTGTYYVSQESMTELAKQGNADVVVTDIGGNAISISAKGEVESDTGAVVAVNAKVEEPAKRTGTNTSSGTESSRQIVIDATPETRAAEEVTKQIAEAAKSSQETSANAGQAESSKSVQETKAAQQETTKAAGTTKTTEPATTKAAQQSEPATSKQQETTKATEPATTKAAETTKATEPATTKAEETTTAHTHTWVDVTKYVQCEAICFV